MLAHKKVENCAVIGVPEDNFGEKPLVFIVPRQGVDSHEDEILEFLADRLASFKRPRTLEFVYSLPLNPMGKVLKTKLREPYWQGRARNI